MKESTIAKKIVALLFLLGLLFPAMAAGHCDRVNGPVAQDALKALQTGQIEPVAIWVGPDEMAELEDVFKESLAAYRLGDDAQKVAEKYFMSTAIRLHRMAEGFPFTGLKSAQPLPEDIALAEKALETGELKPVNDFLAKEMEEQTERLFQQVLTKGEEKKESIEAGREWADAYVKYVIFVHDLHKRISSGAPHGIGH